MYLLLPVKRQQQDRLGLTVTQLEFEWPEEQCKHVNCRTECFCRPCIMSFISGPLTLSIALYQWKRYIKQTEQQFNGHSWLGWLVEGLINAAVQVQTRDCTSRPIGVGQKAIKVSLHTNNGCTVIGCIHVDTCKIGKYSNYVLHIRGLQVPHSSGSVCVKLI